jgi:hypothetical protein
VDQSGAFSARSWLNRSVLGIALASLFSDWSHETATAILPALLSSLSAAPVWLGIIEGFSEQDGRQQLIYQGKDKTRTWSVAEIDELAHRFENSSIALRDLTKEIWKF